MCKDVCLAEEEEEGDGYDDDGRLISSTRLLKLQLVRDPLFCYNLQSSSSWVLVKIGRSDRIGSTRLLKSQLVRSFVFLDSIFVF
jgi:hypothetical protein